MLRALGAGILALAMPVGLALSADIRAVKILDPKDKVDIKSVPAPAGATILFDGKNFDKWVMLRRQGAVRWNLIKGAMQVRDGTIASRENFSAPFTLHVEFRLPLVYEGRARSAILVLGHTIRIEDSYGLDPDKNTCGAIAGVASPLINASKPPTIWQSFDIELRPPRFERELITLPPRLGIGPDIQFWGEPKQVSSAAMTVYQNGVKIQDRVVLKGDAAASRIVLQDHGHPVQFRNIWVVKGRMALPARPAPQPIRLLIRLPVGADLWLNDTKMAGQGSERRFVSPPVEPGFDYSYQIRASWMENGKAINRKRTVKVQPGDNLEVDFLK